MTDLSTMTEEQLREWCGKQICAVVAENQTLWRLRFTTESGYRMTWYDEDPHVMTARFLKYWQPKTEDGMEFKELNGFDGLQEVRFHTHYYDTTRSIHQFRGEKNETVLHIEVMNLGGADKATQLKIAEYLKREAETGKLFTPKKTIDRETADVLGFARSQFAGLHMSESLREIDDFLDSREVVDE